MGNDLSRKFQPPQGLTAIVFIGTISSLAVLFPEQRDTIIPRLASFGHLTCISAWFGIQFWVTFVAGLTKMKLLPRHYFGLVQSHLFPKAFLYGTGFTLAALCTFLIKNPLDTWQYDEKVKATTLLVNLGASLINLLYAIPKMNGFMTQVHKFEKEHGHGEEIGPITDPELLNNQQYKVLRKNFFIYHGIATSLNLLAFAACGVYFWYLSKDIKV